jgi:hypothetical protein
MKYATSLYLGGEPIQALDCDHQSSRELGLLCPTCKEAVFLVAGYGFDRAGKRVRIDPHFSHYKGGSYECEMRCNTRTKEDWEKLRIEAHNQRLDLFNRQFFEVFWAAISEGDPLLSKPHPTRDKRCTKQWRNFAAIKLRRFWQQQFDMIKDDLEYSIAHCFESSTEEDFSFQNEDSAEIVLGYFRQANRARHSAIAHEALGFLTERTSGYALSRCCGLVIGSLDFIGGEEGRAKRDACFQDPREISDLLTGLIASARWLRAIPEFLGVDSA